MACVVAACCGAHSFAFAPGFLQECLREELFFSCMDCARVQAK